MTATAALDARLRTRLAPLLAYLEGLRPGERAELGKLSGILKGLDTLRFEDVDTRQLFSDAGYTRIRLAGNDQFEILLMGWRPGQQSPIHDHAKSTCGARVLKGIASETGFRFTASGHLLAEGTRPTPEGAVFASQDCDIHLIANYEATNLCTLHVYSPPLIRMTQYRFDTADRADFEPSVVDALHGAPRGAPGTIYLNNAATTWPKPEVVYEAVNRALR